MLRCGMIKTAMRYCARDFTEAEIEWIRRMIAETDTYRYQLSLKFCEQFNWRKPDGGLKDMSCRVALLRMERDGWFTLPPRRRPVVRVHATRQRTLFTMPQAEINTSAGTLELHVELVDKKTSALWNEYIGIYHYLGYTPLAGAQLRYIIRHQGAVVALLGFGAAAWSMACRDRFLGWDSARRKMNLHLIVNNARFLILPWVRSKNLASRILAMISKRLANDWEQRYRYRPVLLETCVEKQRFTGTCYKAANWRCVGDTKGRGKLDRHNESKLPIKSVWLYPLCKDYQRYLTENDDGQTQAH